MTNWEKFKEGLTPEKYAELLCEYHGEMPQYAACPYCPIDSICKGGLYGYDCMNPILAWANADVDDITQLLAEVARLTDLAAKIALSHPVGSPEYDLAFDIWSQNVAVANRTPAAYHRAIRAVKGASLPAKEEK